MSLDKFVPLSPDPDLNVGADMTLARFGHLNKLVDEINSGGGGGGSAGIIVEGEGLNSSIRCGVDNQAFGEYGSALSGFMNKTCNEFTASTFGRQSCAIGCYSSVNGTSNVVVARNSHILSGSNNTIACDATQGAWNTQSSYSGNYFGFIVPPSAQLTYGCIYVNNCDLTATYPVGSTFSVTYSYAYGDQATCSTYPTQIQAVNVEVVCSVYNGSGFTCLGFCYDPNSPSFQCTQGDIQGVTTYSYGYIQKTGTFSSYSTYGSTYHPNTIAGGAFNVINGYTSAATISGGYQNTISGGYGTISGGYYNYAENGGTIGGGRRNVSFGGTIAGGGGNKAYYGSFIGAGQANCSCSSSVIVGGGINLICTNSNYSFIGGGRNNTIHTNSAYTEIVGGYCNTICSNSIHAGILGGRDNTISDSANGIILGGQSNTINFSSTYSGILGGAVNCISNLRCTFIIGNQITANRSCATFVNNLSIVDLPTASAGLPSKSLWYDPTTCVVKFVP